MADKITEAEARAREIWGMNPGNPKPWDALSPEEKQRLIALAATIANEHDGPDDQIWNDIDDDAYPIWQSIGSSNVEFSFSEFNEGPVVLYVGKVGQKTGNNIYMTPAQAREIAGRLIDMAEMAEKAGKIDRRPS